MEQGAPTPWPPVPTGAAGPALALVGMAAANVVSPAPNTTGSSQAPACQGHGDGQAGLSMSGQRVWLQLEGCLSGRGQAGRQEAGKQLKLAWGQSSSSLPGAMGEQHPNTPVCTLWGALEQHPLLCCGQAVPRQGRDQGWIRPKQGRVRSSLCLWHSGG